MIEETIALKKLDRNKLSQDDIQILANEFYVSADGEAKVKLGRDLVNDAIVKE